MKITNVIVVDPDGTCNLLKVTLEPNINSGSLDPPKDLIQKCPDCSEVGTFVGMASSFSIRDDASGVIKYNYYCFYDNTIKHKRECTYPDHVYKNRFIGWRCGCGCEEVCQEHRGNIVLAKHNPRIRQRMGNGYDTTISCTESDLEFVRSKLERM